MMHQCYKLSRFFLILFVMGGIATVFSQGETEVYLVDISQNMDGFIFENFKNISNNEGYDNQPYFKDNNTLLYARNNGGQTDISVYDLSLNTETFFNTQTEGGEYSPQPIPNSNDIASVRLDPDGKQRLYRYTEEGNSKELIPDLVIAYFMLYDENTIVASIIEDDHLNLIAYQGKEKQSETLLKGSGRSIHKIPNSKAVSYTAVNEEKNYDIYQLDMKTLESFFICQLPIGIQDYTWFGEDKIIIGSNSQLFVYDLFGNGDWEKIADFSEKGITNITRLAVSPEARKLALVAETKK